MKRRTQPQYYLTLVFLLFTIICKSQEKTKKQFDFKTNRNIAESILKNNEKRNEIKNNKLKVKVLNSCSTNPTLCGTFAFGSVSTVLILDGKFANETILVAELCEKTSYKVGEVYELEYLNEPSFSVNLCSGKSYNSDWNTKIENEYYLTFGTLRPNSLGKY